MPQTITRWGIVVPSGTSLPATGSPGDMFFLTTGTTGTYRCNGTNSWTLFDNLYTSLTGLIPVWGAIIGTLSDQSDLQTALNQKANLASPTFTGTISGITKGMVGLTSVDDVSDVNKPVSSATQTSLNLKAPLSSPTFTGTVTLPASTAFITPVIGVATGTSLATTGAITSSGGGIGYIAGNGGTVTQATSKSTTVVLNKLCGTITLHNAALAAATIVTFTVTNSTVAATDVVIVNHDSVGTTGAYELSPNTAAAGSFKISVRNNTAGSLSEAIVLRFAVFKSSAS